MKNLYMLLLFLAMTVTATAQQAITEKKLEGTWKIASIDLYGTIIDTGTNEVILSAEFMQEDEDTREYAKELFLEKTAVMRVVEFNFEGNHLGMGTDGEVLERDLYTLADRNKVYHLTSPLLDSGDPKLIGMPDDKTLRLVMGETEEGTIILVFTKKT